MKISKNTDYYNDGNEFIAFLKDGDNTIKSRISILERINGNFRYNFYSINVKSMDGSIDKNMILKDYTPSKEYYYSEQFFGGVYDYGCAIEDECRVRDDIDDIFIKQIEFIKSNNLEDIVIMPKYLVKTDKDTYLDYILYDFDYEQSLHKISDLSYKDILKIIYFISGNIEKIHSMGMVYINLNPKNIMFNVDGEDYVKFLNIDFLFEDRKIDVSKKNIVNLESPYLDPELKKFFLSGDESTIDLDESFDAYSLGVMLYKFIFGEYPDDEIRDAGSDRLEKKIEEFFDEVIYRRNFGEKYDKFLERLLNIFRHTIRADGRYKSIEPFIKDIKELIKISNYVGDVNLKCAHTITKYPTYDFRKKKKSKRTAKKMSSKEKILSDFLDCRYKIDIAIIGNSNINKAFFKSIFSATQMTNTEMNIHFFGYDIKEENEILKEMPLLKETTEIYYDYKLRYNKLNRYITDSPFAKLHFYSSDYPECISEAGKLDLDYILIDFFDYSRNIEAVGKLLEIKKNVEKKIFIGYMGKSYITDAERFTVNNSRITLVSLKREFKDTSSNIEFRFDIEDMAYRVHKYYLRQYSPRQNEKNIWKSYVNSKYNVRSSLRSAISNFYKLELLGIDRNIGKMEKADEYYRLVLEDNEKALVRFNFLIYLEHRSWACFAITEGYMIPSYDEMKLYAFNGGNNHVDKTNKLHPLICNSSYDGSSSLESAKKSLWENPGDEYAKYDKLDQLSLDIHGICIEKVESIRNSMFYRMDNVDRELYKDLKKYHRIRNEINLVFSSMEKMFDDEPNAYSSWNRFINELIIKIINIGYSRKIAEELIDISKEMEVVKYRNEYHDFKELDKTMIKALPRLFIGDIDVLYKPFVNEKLYKNIVGAVKFEPRKVEFLLDDDYRDYEWKIDMVRDFLVDKRGMSPEDVNFRVINSDDDLKIDERKINVVDAIGNGWDCKGFSKLSRLSGLDSLDNTFTRGGVNFLKFYKFRRNMTIEEELFLDNVFVESTYKSNLMISLGKSYDYLWSIYTNTNSYYWRKLVILLEHIRAMNTYDVTPNNPQPMKKYTTYKRNISIDTIYSLNIDGVLEDLRDENLIGDFHLPEHMGPIYIITENPEIVDVLNTIFEKIENVKNHRFTLEKSRYIEVKNGKRKKDDVPYYYYIEDETLTVDYKYEINKKYDKDLYLDRELIELIESLYDEGVENSKQLVIKKINNRPVVKEDKSCIRIYFDFVNLGIKNFFRKEGNALETFLYHMVIQNNDLFDDVKMNVEILWKSKDHKGEFDTGVENEIDLVCTKNLRTYFISCKQTEPKTEFLYQVESHTKKFGIDSVGIIVCSNNRTGKDKSRSVKETIRRCEESGVYFIDREMLDTAVENKDYLYRIFRNIINEKKNWKSV